MLIVLLKKRRKIENIITGSGCNDVIEEDIDNPNVKMKTPEKSYLLITF